MEDNKDYMLPNYQKSLILLTLAIIISTIICIYFFCYAYQKFESLHNNTKIHWPNVTNAQLDVYPPWLQYNNIDRDLISNRSITYEDKLLLLKLLDESNPEYNSYKEAINNLAFLSNSPIRSSSLWLLLVGGLAGVLGVQIRTIHDFIGRACYKGSIDFEKWWPWYAIRPLNGFLVGALIIVLSKAKILNSISNSNDEDFIWIAVSVLAGFAVIDVGVRLRSVSKALFGLDDDK